MSSQLQTGEFSEPIYVLTLLRLSIAELRATLDALDFNIQPEVTY